ncbi:BMP family ABC transporter substrate-binding protein [Ilumatobacter sp.]|uniref:BMP family ABC transporter substrate-binding protein n=1 Tax=Ilumatobacter sp. TaxID=1967498 RepID=UPI003AF626A9
MYRPLKATMIGLAGFALIAAPSTITSASGDPGHDHPPEKVCAILPPSGEFAFDFGKAVEMKRALRQARRWYGIRTETASPVTSDDVPAALDTLLQHGDCDMIAGDFLAAFAMQPILGDHPDVRFVALDSGFQGDPPNARGVWFAADEPSFLAGYTAAALTNTGKVGVYGGIPFPTVTAFMDGYALGVEFYNERMGTAVEVLGWDVERGFGLFSFTFDDIDVGRSTTEYLFDQGADIVLPVAGQLQLGSLLAAEDRKASGQDVKVIGVDSDLFKVVDGDPSRVILTSVTKEYDVALLHQIEDLVEHRWEPGVTVEDLSTEGVDLSPWHRLRREVPRWLRKDLRQIERAIERGDIQTEADPPSGPPLGEWFTNPGNGHSYALIEDETFQALESQAVGLGGHLVTIGDVAEQTWLYETFGVGEYLIGLNDIAVPDDFVWTSGEPVTFTNWCNGEPNDANDGEQVVIMGFMELPCWNDVPEGGGIGIVEVAAP